MQRLSEAELAARAGTPVEYIRQLADFGILTRREGGDPFEPGDVQRIRLAEAVHRSGIALEDIGKAIELGALSLAFVDTLFPEPVAVSGTTYSELANELDVGIELLQRLQIGLGLPRPLPEDPVREDDASMLPALVAALRAWLDDASLARVARFFGENIRRVAESEVRFFHANIEEPILRSGLPERQMLELGAQISSQLRPLVDRLLMWLHDRHLEHYIMEDVLEHLENAMEEAGLMRGRPEEMPAMVFLDLTGYTRLTEERGDQVAAELAAHLGELVQESSLRHGGRPIKWLGDGVMFHFPDPVAAVACSLEMVDRAPAAGLPPAHVGVNVGPVIFRDGDYYGRTVNVAARIAAYAGPGQVLVSDEVMSLSHPPDVRFEPIGEVSLKGLSRPVNLHLASRSDPG